VEARAFNSVFSSSLFSEAAQPREHGLKAVEGLGFRVQGSGFRVWGSGFRVPGFGVWGLGSRV
jgi:hypothetical protein